MNWHEVAEKLLEILRCKNIKCPKCGANIVLRVVAFEETKEEKDEAVES